MQAAASERRETDVPRDRNGERGSAIVLAILVSVILTLLGVSFLFMAQTENLIAENEKLSAQALYSAETAARTVKRWFDRPGTGFGFPLDGVVDRSLRRIIDETDPYVTVPPLAAANERYKAGVDLDAVGGDDIFQRPYRGTDLDALMGTEDGPDMRIEYGASAATTLFLDALAEDLLGDFPARSAGVVARVRTIDIYAPPYYQLSDGSWSRYGMGTISVVAQIVQIGGGEEQVIGEKLVKAVLNETPYTGPYGPLHSCGPMAFDDALTETHWGVITVAGEVELRAALLPPVSLPRSLPMHPRSDPVWGADFTATFDEYTAALTPGLDLDDPWRRLVSSGPITGPPGAVSPMLYLTDTNAWVAGGFTEPPGNGLDRSYLVENQFVGCPRYDYDVWKMIASSGESDVRYFAFDEPSGGFVEHGRGDTPLSFKELTDGQQGIYFFDTKDGRPPNDADGDGDIDEFDNLTPPIDVTGNWSFDGVIYLNATRFRAAATGRTLEVVPPGEPFEDLDGDGIHDPGESWLDMDYGVELFTVGDGTAAERETEGVPFDLDNISMRGILYTNGRFDATGSTHYYGTVIAQQGVVQVGNPADAPDLYFDEALVKDWPPDGWNLPRVIISGWITE